MTGFRRGLGLLPAAACQLTVSHRSERWLELSGIPFSRALIPFRMASASPSNHLPSTTPTAITLGAWISASRFWGMKHSVHSMCVWSTGGPDSGTLMGAHVSFSESPWALEMASVCFSG